MGGRDVGVSPGVWLVSLGIRGSRRAPGTILLVGLIGTLALFQHVVAPAIDLATSELVARFAVYSDAPAAVGTWVTAPLLHLSVGHFLKNVGPLLVVGGYLEARYGTATWLVTSTAVGALTYGMCVMVVALTVDGVRVFVGASTIWYGLVTYLALNGETLSVPVPGRGARDVPFRYCFGICLGYAVVSAAVQGGWAPALHLVSLAIGACWWALVEAAAAFSPKRRHPPSRRPSSGRHQ